MAIEPIKIPQNVYIEDRIVGPVTLRQIIVVAIGGGFSYGLYAMLTKAYGSVPLPVSVMAWSPAVVAAIFAFVKINDLSMLRICLLLMERFNKPAQRTWSPRRGIVINIRTFEAQTKEKNKRTEKKLHNVDELSSILDGPVRETHEMEEDNTLPFEEDEDDTQPSARPVDPARISTSTMTANAAAAVPNASVSVFRDLSPQH